MFTLQSSADNGDQIAKLQETYDRARSQASILEQQNASLNDQNNDLIQVDRKYFLVIVF